MNAPSADHPVGQMLISQGLISTDQLRIALLEQSKSGQTVGRLLVSLGFVSEATLRDAKSLALGQAAVDLSRATIEPAALELVPRSLAKRHDLMPLALAPDRRRLTVAMARPNDILALDKLRTLVDHELHIESLLAGEQEILRAIDQHYGHELSIDGVLHEIETGEIDYRSLAAAPMDEYSQPVVRLIDALLTDAVRQEASDIHFEPEAGFLRIRYRIDGHLRQIRALHKSYWPAMAVRLKVIAGMNIAESRAPQDGRLSLNVSGHPVDFRVAVQPTIHGENIVLRILDRQKGIVPLDHLGLEASQLDTLKRMSARPEGLILVTGPTGSGKTTTLYSMLNHINREGISIMTLEDPVEYPMAMLRQTSVSEATRLDFANGVRSMMRQDPDVILVGEIRDRETADMAFQAAMTGHQVYSTLHTNSAIGAIPRLLDIGILPDIMAGNIIGIVAQRLLRRLCIQCRRPHGPDAGARRLLGLTPEQADPVIHSPVGCAACGFQGYRGRFAIMEMLRLDGDIDELIARRATAREILASALAKGFRPLAEEGLRRVLDGTTSLDEVGRVVDLTDRM
ncbi:GspE/PulE family protein [Denitratisoma oestradiolicum]|uniref:Type II secretion system protein E n=1 Tax=Denitratisoma oestradiolicum TaxID=311182 RepID=A0A6S6XZN5_9PROT|nr:ATPase, T2SS/T4P/T4SS family [Denitratisoma oestradiolicum]TWO79097.1 secretion system protein E [Denitratisoma oestradiolicum]CAB1369911.1 Type II secretion system protein E [Denitratisoma oestradiolicum]